MSMTMLELNEAREVTDRALKLPAALREKIAFELLDSVNPPPNTFASKEALQAELKRRIEDIENGRVKALTLEEAMAVIRKAREDRGS